MTLQYIEVRAVLEQHDVQAQRLARKIVQLSPHRLPSLAPLSDIPLYIRTAALYRLSGTLTPLQLDQLITQLLVDPVIQEAVILDDLHSNTTHHTVDVFFHAGVTDTLAESVLTGARMLDISTLEQVETGTRYILDTRLSGDDVRTIAESLLYNPVIQRYEMHSASSSNIVGTRFIASKADLSAIPEQTIS